MKFNTTLLTGALCASLFSYSNCADATIVELDTSLGKVRINLYDEDTPVTVANFLQYVTELGYDGTVIHRSQENFIVQMGSFRYEGGGTLPQIDQHDPIANEPKFSNVQYTVAMAKQNGIVDSATSGFFINTFDNSTNLDRQNGGFTVFGEVTVDTRDVLQAIVDVPIFYTTGDTSNGGVPFRNYTGDDFTNGVEPTDDNFIMIHSVTIFDAATDTAADLTPVANTFYNGTNSTDDPVDPVLEVPNVPISTGSGGGNLGIFSLIMLGLAGFGRRMVKR